MSSPGNLQDIIEKIRILSASSNTNQLTDQKIIKYINSYYLYDFPDDLRILKLKNNYTFQTQNGIDTYAFDFDNYTTIEPPVYCAKSQIALYQDPLSFYGSLANTQSIETFATGDGGVGPYTGTTLGTPIQRSVNNIPGANTFPASQISNILITGNTSFGNTQNVTDDGFGNLLDPVTGVARGTIDYSTGAISVTFGNLIADGNDITIEYKQIAQGQPSQMLFYQEQFVLNPVPDKGYTIEMTCYRTPSQALLGTESETAPVLTGRPELFEWWELIAFGVAKKLYQDRLDLEGVQTMDAFLQEKISEARTSTYAQLSKQRVGTIFSNQLIDQQNYGWGSF
jgi:hypothetical protein